MISLQISYGGDFLHLKYFKIYIFIFLLSSPYQ